MKHNAFSTPVLSLLSFAVVVFSSVLGGAQVRQIPVGLAGEAAKMEAEVIREAQSQFAEASGDCQNITAEVTFKKRINSELVLLDVRLEWESPTCTRRLPGNCQSVYSLKDGLVDLSCGEGDENWE